MKKPNAILMGEAINEEARAAHREGRAPSSTKVIKIFTRRSRNRLSYTETVKLFDFVFGEYQKATGAKASHRLAQTENPYGRHARHP